MAQAGPRAGALTDRHPATRYAAACGHASRRATRPAWRPSLDGPPANPCLAAAGPAAGGAAGLAVAGAAGCRARCGAGTHGSGDRPRSEEHTSELQSQSNLVCRLLLEKKKKKLRESA